MQTVSAQTFCSTVLPGLAGGAGRSCTTSTGTFHWPDHGTLSRGLPVSEDWEDSVTTAVCESVPACTLRISLDAALQDVPVPARAASSMALHDRQMKNSRPWHCAQMLSAASPVIQSGRREPVCPVWIRISSSSTVSRFHFNCATGCYPIEARPSSARWSWIGGSVDESLHLRGPGQRSGPWMKLVPQPSNFSVHEGAAYLIGPR